jgi:ureidoacrylate peracid hydrolase
VAEFLAAVDAARRLPRKGDKVLGFDHLTVGTVEEVVEDDAETPGYMVVPRGLVFEREIFIPLEAVVKVGDGEVFVNVPGLLISKMPWGERPTSAKRREKLGPRREEVANLYPSRSTAPAFNRPKLQSTEQAVREPRGEV